MSLHHHFKSPSCDKCGSSPHSKDYKVENDAKERKGEKFLRPISIHFTAALEFKSSHLQKHSEEYKRQVSRKIAIQARKMDV